MTENEIYRLWLSSVKDGPRPRYMRPLRWQEIKKAIIKHKIRSVLEFGSGVSTLLLENLGLQVDSYETDPEYMKKVKRFTKRAHFYLWDNENAEITKNYDLAIVDGALPRGNQLKLAVSHAPIVAVDDFGPKFGRDWKQYLNGAKRINASLSLMAIFKAQ